MKKKLAIKLLFILLVITCVSFDVDLKYKDVANGKLKILIPSDFGYKMEKVPDSFNPDDSRAAEIFSNKDSTVQIIFFVIPKDDHFEKIRAMAKMMSPIMSADKSRAFKENFNDTTTINGYRIYLFDYQGKIFKDYPERTMMFFVNTTDREIAGTINYALKPKDQWSSISEKILHSIKLN